MLDVVPSDVCVASFLVRCYRPEGSHEIDTMQAQKFRHRARLCTNGTSTIWPCDNALCESSGGRGG